MSASEVITELRKRLGISRQKMAERIGLKGEFIIYQYEKSKRYPSRITWLKIADLAKEAGMLVTMEMLKED